MALVKRPAEIEIMAEAGRKLAKILSRLEGEVRVGITTDFLDKLSAELIRQSGATPAFLGYQPAGAKKPYPNTLCASLNDVVVHGLPSSYQLREGDVLKIDLGLKYRGFFVDSALTVPVGKVREEAKKLIQVTKQALNLAIRELEVGKTLGDVGHAIQSYVRKNKFSIVCSLTGHGIGRSLHEEPAVLNFGKPGTGLELSSGMVLAIEPMTSSSNLPNGCNIRELPDGSFTTNDQSLSVHFEHTVAITETGPMVLTAL